MTTRSLFQKIAKNYKQRSERSRKGEKTRISLAIKPPLTDIRDHALEITKNHHITHKPDRYIGGSIFKKTAYGVVTLEGEKDQTTKSVQKLTLKTKLETLATGSKSKDAISTRKKLELITPESTKNIVLDSFDKRIQAGKTAEQALIDEMLYPGYNTPIKRVRIIQNKSVDTSKCIKFTSRHSNSPHEKHIQYDGNAYFEITTNDAGKPEIRPVKMDEAYQNKGKPLPPTAMRFYKGDTIIDTKDGKQLILKQMKTAGKFIMAQTTEANEVLDLEKIAKQAKKLGLSYETGLRSVSGKGILRLVVL